MVREYSSQKEAILPATRPSDSLTKQATYLPSNLPSNAKLSYFVKARSGNSSTDRDIATVTYATFSWYSAVKPVSRPKTKKLSRTTSRNSPLLIMATDSPFMVILNSPARSHFISVRSLGNECSLGSSATGQSKSATQSSR
jgi:hypothetical protein